jgi:hypothetical protein
MSAPQNSSDLHVVEKGAAIAGVETVAKPKRATEKPGAEPAASAAESAPTQQRRGLSPWLLGVVALIGVVAWVTQYQVSQRLEREVAGLSAELASTSEQLGAYKLHLDTVRASVGDLHDRMGNLKILVGLDPTAITDIPAADDLTAPLSNISAPAPISARAAAEPATSREAIIDEVLSTPLS